MAAGTVAGFSYWSRRWNYIFIHHSAGNYGNIDFIQKVHRDRQKNDPVDAIPYHYIIGNGNGMREGEVAYDWRQEYDIWGAHLSSGNSFKNFLGLGICLIGNFEKYHIKNKQYDALVSLTRDLMGKYSIPIENVSGHGYTKGEHTKCPGKLFPMDKFLKDIAKS